MDRPDSSKISPDFKSAIDLWVTEAIPPGDFLSACLENNLKNAFGLAGAVALENLPHIVSYLYGKCPGNCWGSEQRVADWPAKLADIKRTAPTAHDILRKQRGL